jgi:hypothetical protein
MKNNCSFQKESQKMSKNKLHFNEFKRKLRKIITNLPANFAREKEFWRHIPDHFYGWCRGADHESRYDETVDGTPLSIILVVVIGTSEKTKISKKCGIARFDQDRDLKKIVFSHFLFPLFTFFSLNVHFFNKSFLWFFFQSFFIVSF